jgi:hypothetical protein
MLTRYEIVGMNIRLFGGGIFIGYFDGFGYWFCYFFNYYYSLLRKFLLKLNVNFDVSKLKGLRYMEVDDRDKIDFVDLAIIDIIAYIINIIHK